MSVLNGTSLLTLPRPTSAPAQPLDAPRIVHPVVTFTSRALRKSAAITMRAWLSMYFRLRISGRNHIPATGSCIIVANHTSHLDTLCLLAALPLSRLEDAHPLAASDYFFSSPAACAMSRFFFNALPFGRHGNVRRSLDQCHQLLASGDNILIVFPEGTRSQDGNISPFKPGIGQLVASTHVPVIPCHISGAHQAWPRGRRLPKPSQVRLRIGAPLSFNHLPRCRDSAHQIAREVEQRVRALVFQSNG